MKKLVYIFLLLIGLNLFSYASTNVDLQVLKATNDIKYLSQKIANDYIYYFNNPKRVELKNSLDASIKQLEEDFRFVASNTDNVDTKNVLDYLSYSKDEIKDLLTKNIELEDTKLMLDHSESLYEGAQSILDEVAVSNQDIKVNLMRISKIYMASHVIGNSMVTPEMLQQEIKIVDIRLSSNSLWQTFREILSMDNSTFLPNIVTILVKDMESGIK